MSDSWYCSWSSRMLCSNNRVFNSKSVYLVLNGLLFCAGIRVDFQSNTDFSYNRFSPHNITPSFLSYNILYQKSEKLARKKKRAEPAKLSALLQFCVQNEPHSLYECTRKGEANPITQQLTTVCTLSTLCQTKS